MQWPAIEPEKGVYNQAYLNGLSDQLNWFADAGVHVMLDMHQDKYGEYFGNGAPVWAVIIDGYKNEPIDVPQGTPWWMQYFINPGLKKAFDNF